MELYLMGATSLILILMTAYIATRKNKRALHYYFLMLIVEIFVLTVAVMMQGFSTNKDQFILWEKITYFGSALLPVTFIHLGIAFVRPDKSLSFKTLILFIIPFITIVFVSTNALHHMFFNSSLDSKITLDLFRAKYPSLPDGIITPDMYGPYFYIHAAYSYICLVVSFVYLSYFAVKNSGIWSVQAILIIIGSLVPTTVNIIYTLKIWGTVYSTPIAFTFTLALYLFAMFKFNFLKVTPIALQTVINRISDSFIVVDGSVNIIDYNKTFIDNFHYFSALRKGENFYTILKGSNNTNLDAEQFKETIMEAARTNTTLIKDMESEVKGQRKYYTVEFTPISQRSRVIGIVLLFKNITQHVLDMQQIQENQAILLERERLASLGQLIGGIAHNLKTPIMSVAGGIDQLQWLSKEYSASIDDAEVTSDDHKEIATEMQQWLTKMKLHMGYMSDIISTVKDQASKFNNPGKTWFTIDEMLKRVKILMQHELVKNKCSFKQNILVRSNLRVDGDLNSMVQILDNIIVNAIQAYGSRGGEIVLKITKEDNSLFIVVCDFASGIDEKVKDKLFKEMITTKGKHGTGLGLYMSYSTVKGMFRGNMWFESNVGKGTKFYIQLPIHEEETTEVSQYA